MSPLKTRFEVMYAESMTGFKKTATGPGEKKNSQSEFLIYFFETIAVRTHQKVPLKKRRYEMKRLFFALALILAFAGMAAAAEAPAGKPAANPLKEEMWLLDTAYKGLIDAIVLRTPGAIAGPFEEVLKAKAKTEAALEKGTVWLPKNNERKDEFKKMDEDYHRMIEDLIRLSKKGDMKGVQALSHRLLDGCVRCHNTFRR